MRILMTTKNMIATGFVILIFSAGPIRAQTSVRHWPKIPFCQYNETNVVPNCGFEEINDDGPIGWTLVEGTELKISSIEDADVPESVLSRVRSDDPIGDFVLQLMDFARSGEKAISLRSAKGESGNQRAHVKSTCFSANSLQDHVAGFRGKQVGYDAVTHCKLGLNIFSEECGVDGTMIETQGDRIHGLSWSWIQYDFESTEQFKYMEVHLLCYSDDPFTILLDDISLTEYQRPKYEEGEVLSKEEIMKDVLRQEKNQSDQR